MDIEACLDIYCDPFYHDFYGINHQMTNDELLREQSRDFLLNFALSESEYKNQCIPIQQKIFRCLPEKHFDISSMSLSDIMLKDFMFFAYYSAPLFWKETYEQIRRICEESGDNYIFIVEEECCERNPKVAFKLKIPVSKSWDELKNGGYISDVLFNMFNHNYYVFGDSGKWGKWCDYDNDYIDYEVFVYKDFTPPVKAYMDYFSEYLTENVIPLK